MVDVTPVDSETKLQMNPKDQGAKKWLHLRQEVLSYTAKDVIEDIQNHSLAKPEDLTEVRPPIWNPQIQPFTERKMVLLCEKGQWDFSNKGFESLKAGLFFATQEKDVIEDGSENYLIPYPVFKENGDYDESHSLIIKLTPNQYKQLKELIDKEK